MDSFSSLVEEEWTSFKELQSLTTGRNLSIMFADLSEDAALIMAAAAEEEQHDPQSAAACKEQLCHLMSVAEKLGYFAVPAREQSDKGATLYIVFQLLGFKPWNRKYIQRLTRWATDDWKGSLSCAILGTLAIPVEARRADENTNGLVQQLPGDVNFKSCASCVQPLALQDIFLNNHVDFMYQFKNVIHRTELDNDSVKEALQDDEDIDETLAILGVNFNHGIHILLVY